MPTRQSERTIVPTGVAMRDPREHVLATAARVLARDGPNALTSRVITTEAGVAKGVLHRHFTDFDDVLVQLTRMRIREIDDVSVRLAESVGTRSVTGNLARTLPEVFDAVTLGLLALLMTRDEPRTRLRSGATLGIPLATDITAMIATYLEQERERGRLTSRADPQALALSVVGTGHLLFAGEDGGLPDASSVRAAVESILVGVERGG